MAGLQICCLEEEKEDGESNAIGFITHADIGRDFQGGTTLAVLLETNYTVRKIQFVEVWKFAK